MLRKDFADLFAAERRGAKECLEGLKEEAVDALDLATDEIPDTPSKRKKLQHIKMHVFPLILQQLEARDLPALMEPTNNSEVLAAIDPLLGINEMMDLIAEHYGLRYAPNTRETGRRQTIHQFLDAGIVLKNPDNPSRPVNSPNNRYRIEPGVLDLLRTFGTEAWEVGLETHLSSVRTLRERYAQEREMARIPITLPSGETITLSPGGQNILVERIIHEFCPRFTPGARLLYLGDTDEKLLYFEKDGLEELGVSVEEHGKMPDVVVYHTEKNWLLLIEAVTSHGPVDPKRRAELTELFKGSTAGLVFVTTFLNRQAMLCYLPEIAWETEVWVAEAPTHMIHFNGERFLGPYDAS